MSDKRRTAKRLTEDQIVANSKITDEDIGRARAWWRSHVTAPLRDLIDAKIEKKDGD